MKDRQSPRVPLHLPVRLGWRRSKTLRCRTRNVSMQGMFVELAPDAIEQNHHVQLCFAVTAGGISRICRVPGKIAHVATDGVGLHYLHPATGALSDLLQILDARQGSDGTGAAPGLPRSAPGSPWPGQRRPMP